MKIDYNAIKRCIIKACKQENSIVLDFKINADKLNASVQELGLTFIDNFTRIFNFYTITSQGTRILYRSCF